MATCIFLQVCSVEVFDYISFEFCVQAVPANTARQFSLGPVLGMESFSSDEK